MREVGSHDTSSFIAAPCSTIKQESFRLFGPLLLSTARELAGRFFRWQDSSEPSVQHEVHARLTLTRNSQSLTIRWLDGSDLDIEIDGSIIGADCACLRQASV